MPSTVHRRLRANRIPLTAFVALAAAGIATGLSLALGLETHLGAQVVYVVLAAAAAVVAGLAAGLAAGALSLVPFVYFFLNRPDAFDVDPPQVVSLLVLVAGVVLVSYLVSREQRARALSAGAESVREALNQSGTAIWNWDVERDRLRWSGDVRGMYGLGSGCGSTRSACSSTGCTPTTGSRSGRPWRRRSPAARRSRSRCGRR